MNKLTTRIPCFAWMLILTAQVTAASLAQTTHNHAAVGSPPPYHPAPPVNETKLPPILGRERLWAAQWPFQRKAYELAANLSSLIYQLPCECHCASIGHTSLRSCFESEHAMNCYVCMKEVFYAAQESSRGKNASQIREGIARGEHNKIYLESMR